MDNVPAIISPGQGHNSEQTLKDLGAIGRKAIKEYDRFCASAGRSAVEAQVRAILLGKVIYEGKQLHSSTREYGKWLTRNKLDVGSLGAQPELNACMHLYERVELNKEFTLTGCRDTIPTNIMKWARRQNGHLFDKKPTKKRTRSLLDDIIDLLRTAPEQTAIDLKRAMKDDPELARFKRTLVAKE